MEAVLSYINSSLPRHYPKWQGVQGSIPNDGLQLVEIIKSMRLSV